MTTTIRVTDAQIARVRCAQGHTGNTTLVTIQGGTAAKDPATAKIYTAEQVAAARPGVPGEGGVILR